MLFGETFWNKHDNLTTLKWEATSSDKLGALKQWVLLEMGINQTRPGDNFTGSPGTLGFRLQGCNDVTV
jgi:hypothetical protein